MRFLSAKTAITSLLIAMWAATIAVNWPGHLSNDSVIQLLEGRTGHYETWHPPVMAWLLGLFDFAVPGAGLFVVFVTTLFYAALLLLTRVRARASWLAIPVLLLFALTPQLILYPGLVWKDVLFADSAVAGFACLAFAAGRWQRPRLRYAFIAASLLLLVLAALTRQNGVVVSVMAAPALGVIAFTQNRRAGQALAAVVIFLITLLAFVSLATAALNLRADHGKGRRDEIKMLQLYDLSGAAARDPSVSLADLRKSDPAFEHLIRTDGARLYTPQRVDPLQQFSPIEQARDAAPATLMMTQWLHVIAQHPLLYLGNRAEIFRWVFLTPQIDRCLPFLIGVSGPQNVLDRLKMPPRYDDRDEALEDYARPLVHAPVFSHGAFAALAAVLFVLLLRRRAPADIAIAFLLAGSAVFTLTFFAISLACDYRYLYLLDLSAIVAAVHAALGRAGWREGAPS